jgi:hypothetical protein
LKTDFRIPRDIGSPNVISQKAKGKKLTIFFEKLIFFKAENVTDENKQTTNLGLKQTGCGG